MTASNDMKAKISLGTLQLLDSFPEPRILLDAQYRILAANAAYRREFSADKKVEGRYCYQLSHHYDKPCDQAGENCPLRETMASGEPSRVLHVHHTSAGREHVEVEMVPVKDARGSTRYYVETMHFLRQAGEAGDGRKMSKSYDNVIPIFAPASQVRKRVMSVVTDSRSPEEPKNPDECNVFNIYRFFATPEEVADMRQKYLRGGFGYGEVKQHLFEVLERKFGEARLRYEAYSKDRAFLDKMLLESGEKARSIGAPLMRKVRKAVGVRYNR